jgi:Ca2+-binding EF-hand superfamily protein
MDYMDVLIHGAEKEKFKQSFEILDIRGRSKVTYADFVKVAINVTRMWSAAYGKPGKIIDSYSL